MICIFQVRWTRTLSRADTRESAMGDVSLGRILSIIHIIFTANISQSSTHIIVSPPPPQTRERRRCWCPWAPAPPQARPPWRLPPRPSPLPELSWLRELTWSQGLESKQPSWLDCPSCSKQSKQINILATRIFFNMHWQILKNSAKRSLSECDGRDSPLGELAHWQRQCQCHRGHCGPQWLHSWPLQSLQKPSHSNSDLSDFTGN